MLNFETEVCL